MNPTRNLRGLYVITDSALLGGSDRLVPAVAAAIAGGAALVQYRDKSADAGRRRWEAEDLAMLCRPLGIPLIINDDVALAVAVGAGGVHLGLEDGDIAAARAALGPAAIIGATCHADLERAQAAVEAGADYVAFGRFFPSRTKPGAPPATLALLREARARLRVPLCAIGGVTPENAPELVAAGADLLAVVHGVFGQPDIRAAAAAYAGVFKSKSKDD